MYYHCQDRYLFINASFYLYYILVNVFMTLSKKAKEEHIVRKSLIYIITQYEIVNKFKQQIEIVFVFNDKHISNNKM